MLEQVSLLAKFVYAPRRAASGVLDHGKFVFALIAALLVAGALTVASEVSKTQEIAKLMQQFSEDSQALGGGTPGRVINPDDFDQPAPNVAGGARQQALANAMRYQRAVAAIEGRYFGSSWRGLAVLGIFFVPACLIIGAAWAHLGSPTTVLFRDYMPLLVNCLFAWTAAHLPVAALWFAGVFRSPDAIFYSQIAGFALFLFLSTFCLESVLGISLGQGFGVAAAGVAASIAGGYLFVLSSGLMYMFLTPWALYYIYMLFGRDLGSLSGGLASRQNFKRQLEIATVNPHDADAHYQLGLIYKQRRNLTEAESSFRRALEIDRDEENVLFELGKLLRETNRFDDARPLLERAARINEKLANHEVWRELGALEVAAGHTQDALNHLARYVERREYDPEGLVLYGRALKAANRAAEARTAFDQAIQSARTAPAFRRHELRKFEKMADQEIRSL